jgi:protein-S-isoprenylcysteine O-methyltransferase Ste14
VSRIPSLGPRGEGWVGLQLVAIALVAMGGRLGAPVAIAEPARAALDGAGWLLVAAGAVLIFVAFALLRGVRTFSALPKPIPGGSLVESGPYRFIRHPIYAGLILGGLGLAATRASPPTALATALLFVVLDLKRRREEAWLAERFPEYAVYRTRTRALFPFIY